MPTPLLLDSLNSPQRIHGRHTVTERRDDHTSVCSNDGKISKNVVLCAWIHRVNVNYPPTFLEGQTSFTYPAKGFEMFSRLKKKKKKKSGACATTRVGGVAVRAGRSRDVWARRASRFFFLVLWGFFPTSPPPGAVILCCNQIKNIKTPRREQMRLEVGNTPAAVFPSRKGFLRGLEGPTSSSESKVRSM